MKYWDPKTKSFVEDVKAGYQGSHWDYCLDFKGSEEDELRLLPLQKTAMEVVGEEYCKVSSERPTAEEAAKSISVSGGGFTDTHLPYNRFLIESVRKLLNVGLLGTRVVRWG